MYRWQESLQSEVSVFDGLLNMEEQRSRQTRSRVRHHFMINQLSFTAVKVKAKVKSTVSRRSYSQERLLEERWTQSYT